MSRALDAHRVVTLTGAPGIGKTRLALAVAAAYPEGRVVVELAPVADPALVPVALMSVLAVPDAPGLSVIEGLLAHLRQRRVLLVLDNCEHVLEACAELVERLLSGCSALRVLASSREPLSLAQERVWRVPPLAVPELRDDATDPEALTENFAAVRLFVERAVVVEPSFALNGYVAPAVVEVCRRLDGIPLAIELAAARVPMLTPAEIASRLDDRFRLLINGDGGAPIRHETLEAALDWSYELLSAAERALLRRLSVFVGGVELEAVQVVCAGGELSGDEVHGLLGRLVSKSLVVDTRSGSAGRYHLLESIRAYAAERLEATGELPALREAHARSYLALAERAEPELTGASQQEWLGRLESERENLRSAVDWSLGHGKAEWALRIAGSVVLFWRVRCHFSEGRDLLEAAITADNGQAPAASRAKALWGAGLLNHMLGNTDAAIAQLKRSLATAIELGDLQARARALLVLGNATQARLDPAALELLDQAASLAREAGDSWCLAHALAIAGLERCHRDEHDAARRQLEECVSVARAARDSQGLRFGLLGLGELAGRRGDYPLATAVFEQLLAVADELGEDYMKATALGQLGQVAYEQGEHRRAAGRLDAALGLMRVARPDGLIGLLVLRGRVACVEGDRALNRRLLQEALPLARGGAPDAAAAFQAMGEQHAAEGNGRSARRLFEEALDISRSVGDKRQASWALQALGQLARGDHHAKRAAMYLTAALELHREIQCMPASLISIEVIAGLAADVGRAEHAAGLLGAASALREAHDVPRQASDSRRYDVDLRLVRDLLPTAEFEAAFAAGGKLSLVQAVAQALNGRSESRCRHDGWQTMTDTERQVAALVAEGMMNREIAKLLFMSPSTVGNHLTNIFAKLGIQRRTQLAREVLRRVQV